MRISECRGGNWRAEEVAYCILPFKALCKKGTMCASYTANLLDHGIRQNKEGMQKMVPSKLAVTVWCDLRV